MQTASTLPQPGQADRFGFIIDWLCRRIADFASRNHAFIPLVVLLHGGAEGYLNENRETGLISDRGHAGIMHLTSGCRQFGVHEHTITEIYVILQGEVESIEPGRTQKAGPLDVLYMPPKAPHAVRASGDEAFRPGGEHHA